MARELPERRLTCLLHLYQDVARRLGRHGHPHHCRSHLVEVDPGTPRRFFGEREHGKLGVAPGHGVHVLATLAEADVAGQIAGIVEAAPDIAISPGDALPGDFRDACQTVADGPAFDEEKGFALYRAAVLAIKGAVARVTPAL